MALWRRHRRVVDRSTPDDLATFGRYHFLQEQSGIDAAGVFTLTSGLNELVFTQSADDRAVVVAELSRHAEHGEWEKVGAWKYVREFLDDADDTRDLIHGGLLAVRRMRVTNLSIHLSSLDSERYRELTGEHVPDDGFWGPPVFDSHYGPSRQYYLDNAVAVAARRTPSALVHRPGITPERSENAARGMWDFGMLVYRGPLVVPPDIASEATVVAPALAAANGVDHVQFLEHVVEHVFAPGSFLLGGPWATIGAARFAEDYLDPSTLRSAAHARLLDTGLTHLLETGALGLVVAPEILTPLQRERLHQIQAGR